ncbi:hypothetical protein SAMN05216571_101412 [Onishia taeanensis]|uniref:Uncharacterized protein n=1 Tax=Onishia taeanensis TaxID=284577 RepID=A0A1G7NFQ0_9GAMM|nr:hypothetical protein [Halomonas taeanensis]SDF72782.1 hypothetical protein SAMN05216571_101412 [Halomonas taeanensis]
MATRQGGVYRRKNGKTARVVEPAADQRLGAHAVHPITGNAKPDSVKGAATGGTKSTQLKGGSDADANS